MPSLAGTYEASKYGNAISSLGGLMKSLRDADKIPPRGVLESLFKLPQNMKCVLTEKAAI